MPEHEIRRPWIKLWTQEYIHGTTRHELLPDERSVWTDFMALAGDSSKLGFICIAEDIAYTDEQLAKLLNISTELLQRSILKMLGHNKIKRNGTGVIELVNFWKYQPQFDRTEYQRKYMNKYRKGHKSKTNRKSNTDKSNISKPNTISNEVNLTGKTNCKRLRREESRLNKEEKPTLESTLLQETNNSMNGNILSSNVSIIDNDDKLKQFIMTYEGNIGVMTPIMLDELRYLSNKYALEWFNEAVKRAIDNNKRKMSYIKAILEQWEVNGFKYDSRKQKTVESQSRPIRKSTEIK